MAIPSRWALRILLVLVGAAHLAIGVGVNVSTEFPKLAATAYGVAAVNWTPELVHLLRPLGVYMIALGLLTIVAAWNPVRQRVIVYTLSGLLIARALQRLVFFEEIQRAFGISATRNIASMVFFLAIGAALFALEWRAARSLKSEPVAS